ncbi:MAG: PEGA domain-containing protein [Firmicutes bacterium]|nr:PEGA domain-containing protein [Candidatus Fermentithermobacillaceae bacterium]
MALTLTGLLTGCAANAPAKLLVESEPKGAAVFLDGTEMGKTPATLEGVKPGRRRVTLTYPGYREWSTEVELLPGKEHKVSANLSPLPPEAVFEIRSEPAGADVFIDGRYCGQTPVKVEIPESTFCLTVAKPGYLWVQEFVSPRDVRSSPRSYSAVLRVGGLAVDTYLLPGGFDPEESVKPVAIPEVTLGRDRMVIGPLETESPLQIPNVPRISPGRDYLAMVITAPSGKWLGGRWGEALVVFNLSTGESKVVYSSSGAVLGESQRLGLPGIRILGFTARSELVVLTWSQGKYVPEFEVRVLDIETGGERRVPGLFSPADGRQLCSWWFSRDRNTLFLELYRFGNEIIAVDLASGSAKTVYSGVPQSPAYGCPVIAPSPEGWQVLWGMKLEGAGLHVVDLRNGVDKEVFAEEAVFGDALWSPDGRWVAVPVGKPGGRWKNLRSYPDSILLADAVVILSSGGEKQTELALPGKLIADLVWLPDSSGIVAKTAVEVGEWNLAHTGTYALMLDGSTRELLSGDVEGATLLTDLPQVDTDWVFFSSWKENGEEHWAFNGKSDSLIKLPAKPVAVAGDVVLVRSGDYLIERVLLTKDGATKVGTVSSLALQWWDVVEFTGDLLIIDGEREEERTARFVTVIRLQR